ncbi:hypothetical protein GH714_040028 [Hevea brasiliensis]|uniref:Reticulon-like protein n=1 Tax=Hevea brasiliensis TaxID=3981 RepID=A0A6A6MTM0_HEVBR|nr:hypothetical protein GH714_040028 [Hevea brasiliensis]
MAEHAAQPESAVESLMDKITDKTHSHDSSSSSSDSDDDKPSKVDAAKSKIFRLFAADVLLWRNKKTSAGILGGATTVWFLFELLEYHLITLLCHLSILSLAILFLWSNASTFINKSPPDIIEILLPEKCVLEVASALRIEINRALAVLHDIAAGRDVKKFLTGSCNCWPLDSFDYWKLVQLLDLVLHSLCSAALCAVSYEKYENQVDSFSEKAWIEIKKQYAVFEAKVLSKIPKGPLKEKKKD